MDKAQKQLLTSYYKARHNAINDRGSWKDNEMNYAYNNLSHDFIIKYDIFNHSGGKATFLNQKLNTDKFWEIYKFNLGNGNIAKAYLNDNSKMFINKQGQPSVEGLTFKEVEKKVESYYYTAFFNQKLNINKFNDVSSFTFANNTISLAELTDDTKIFINKEGEPSVDGVNFNDIDFKGEELSKKQIAEYKKLYNEVYNNTLNMINNG